MGGCIRYAADDDDDTRGEQRQRGFDYALNARFHRRAGHVTQRSREKRARMRGEDDDDDGVADRVRPYQREKRYGCAAIVSVQQFPLAHYRTSD